MSTNPGSLLLRVLPQELKDMIWKETFDEIAVIGKDYHVPDILLVCKEVRQSAIQVYYKVTIFEISQDDVTEWLDTRPLVAIRRIPEIRIFRIDQHGFKDTKIQPAPLGHAAAGAGAGSSSAGLGAIGSLAGQPPPPAATVSTLVAALHTASLTTLLSLERFLRLMHNKSQFFAHEEMLRDVRALATHLVPPESFKVKMTAGTLSVWSSDPLADLNPLLRKAGFEQMKGWPNNGTSLD